MARIEIDQAVLITNVDGTLRFGAGAHVQVNIRGGGAATVYADSSSGTTLSNPLTADSAGRIEGWVDQANDYDLVVSGAGFTTYTQPFVIPRGDTGATGATGPAGVGANWRGVWSSATTYALADGVYRTGVPYISNVGSNLNHDPATDTGTNWGRISTGGLPAGWLSVKDPPYNAVGNGIADDATAIQAAITAIKAGTGTVLYFPPGVYMVGTTLNFDSYQGFTMRGPSGGMQYQSTPATLVYTGTATGNTGGLIHFNSCYGFEVCYLGFDYNSESFTGDLVTMDGQPHAADNQDWHFHHCTTRARTASAAGPARSTLRLNRVIIGSIDHCHFTGALNPLRIGDPANQFVGELELSNCTFNFARDTHHIFVGSPDMEQLTIRHCTFEAGTNTGGIRFATIARDGAICQVYNCTMANNWFGDASTSVDWISGIRAVALNPFLIQSNYFGDNNGGTHIVCDPTTGSLLNVLGNSFNNGTCVSTQGSGVMTGNYFADVVRIFESDNRQMEMYGNRAAYGTHTQTEWNTPWDFMPDRVAFGSGTAVNNFPGGNFDAGPTNNQESLVIGAYNTAALKAMGKKAAIYTIPSPTGGPNRLIIQAATGDAAAEVHIAADTTPAAVVKVGAAKLGFYGTNPIVQAARAGQLTDSTGGSVSGTLAAGITDTVAKNAIASLAAKVNALETIIHNLGLSA
jgi:hypothetical protein